MSVLGTAMARRRRTNDSERDEAMLGLLKSGHSPAEVADALGLPKSVSREVCASLRAQYGIPGKSRPPPKRPPRRRLSVEVEFRAMLVEVARHLGPVWLREYLGRESGALDEDQIIDLQQLHAALRFHLVDAGSVLADVQTRLREILWTELGRRA